ncbi:MAG: response regulator [Proteobacteria bacterium]|nr:response regulator [Pseudomonadota bacterium]
MAPRILVADDDAWILRMVTTILTKRGYQVDTAQDGEQAYERALEQIPDLLITDVMMPKMDGWTLVRALRSRPEFTFVPVIFLTALSSDEDRIRGFRLGADDYLPKPFRFEELDLRVAKTMRRRQVVEKEARSQVSGQPDEAGGSGQGEPAALAGDLKQIGLSVLLTLLEMERKSGILTVKNYEQTARVFLRDGRVVRAVTEGGAVRPVNAECVYYLLNWSSGRFEFTQSVSEVEGMPDEVGIATTQLLMEGAKRIDELNEAARLALESGSSDGIT